MMGAIVCSKKAELGVIKHKKSLEKISSKISREGLKYLKNIQSDDGIIELNAYYVIIIPNLTTRKVKSTVGLGDSISSTAFVSETI